MSCPHVQQTKQVLDLFGIAKNLSHVHGHVQVQVHAIVRLRANKHAAEPKSLQLRVAAMFGLLPGVGVNAYRAKICRKGFVASSLVRQFI